MRIKPIMKEAKLKSREMERKQDPSIQERLHHKIVSARFLQEKLERETVMQPRNVAIIIPR